MKDHWKGKSKPLPGRTSGKKKRFAGIGDFCYFCMLVAFLGGALVRDLIRRGEMYHCLE